MDYQIRNRDVTFEEFFSSVSAKITDKPTLHCLAGGPGLGKTRTLLELCFCPEKNSFGRQFLKRKFPEYEKTIEGVLFLPIAFNNLTLPSQANGPIDLNPRLAVAARIIHSYFCDLKKEVSWQDFALGLGSSFSLTPSAALSFVAADMAIQKKFHSIILLIDESKAAIEVACRGDYLLDGVDGGRKDDFLSKHPELNEKTAREILLFSDLMRSLEEARSRHGNLQVLISSLSFQSFYNFDSQDASLHKLFFVSLPPLRDRDILELAAIILSGFEKSIPVVRDLILLSNGFPRLLTLIFNVLTAVHHHSKTLVGDIFHRLGFVMNENNKVVFRDIFLNRPSLLRRAIVHSILGIYLTPQDMSEFSQYGLVPPPQPNKRSIPFMTSFALWHLGSRDDVSKTVRDRTDSPVSFGLAELLLLSKEIVSLNTQEFGKRFEHQVCSLISLRILCQYFNAAGDTANTEADLGKVACDTLVEGTSALSLKTLFQYDSRHWTWFEMGNSDPFFNIRLSFKAITEAQSLENHLPDVGRPPTRSMLLFPKSDQAAGLDLVINGVSEGKPEHYVIALQLKESAEESTTSLGLPKIAKSLVNVIAYHSWAGDFIGKERFYFGILALRDTTNNLSCEGLLAAIKEVKKPVNAKWIRGEEEVKKLAKEAAPFVFVIKKEGVKDFFTRTFSHFEPTGMVSQSPRSSASPSPEPSAGVGRGNKRRGAPDSTQSRPPRIRRLENMTAASDSTQAPPTEKQNVSTAPAHQSKTKVGGPRKTPRKSERSD